MKIESTRFAAVVVEREEKISFFLQHGKTRSFLIVFHDAICRRKEIERVAVHHRVAGRLEGHAGSGSGRVVGTGSPSHFAVILVARESVAGSARCSGRLLANRAAVVASDRRVVHFHRLLLLLLLLQVFVVAAKHTGRISSAMMSVPLVMESEISAQIGVQIRRRRCVGIVVVRHVRRMVAGVLESRIVLSRKEALLLLLLFVWRSGVVCRSHEASAAAVLEGFGAERERQLVRMHRRWLRTPFGTLLFVTGRASTVGRQAALIVGSVRRFGLFGRDRLRQVDGFSGSSRPGLVGIGVGSRCRV